ncbi:chaplin family protein [Streptomyces sp. NPDC126503]|uniref:chaplin family protein n=1 Tax=Streptomyces sp. NPDC126503 TaxID=3155315 RepID=UPI003316CF71
MINRRTAATATALATAALGAPLTIATPAFAGGIGDVLAPAFGTSCANQHAAHATGNTTHGTGTAAGNLAGLPLGSPLNQCGGADLPLNHRSGAVCIYQGLPGIGLLPSNPADASPELVAKVVSLLTETSIYDAKPLINGSC